MPWKLMVNALKLQIVNVLVHRKKMNLNDALLRHLNALVNYDPLIHEVMETLKKECPWKGFPTIMGRNP